MLYRLRYRFLNYLNLFKICILLFRRLVVVNLLLLLVDYLNNFLILLPLILKFIIDLDLFHIILGQLILLLFIFNKLWNWHIEPGVLVFTMCWVWGRVCVLLNLVLCVI